MVTESLLLTLLLGFSPDAAPADITTDPICSPLPPEPLRIQARPFASTAGDGTRTWGAEAIYELSTGDVGEAFMVLDEFGAGEVQLMINGEIIAHVAMAASSSGEGPVLTTWMPATVTAAPESIAEMMRLDLPAIVADSIPQEFKCSAWGRKVMKAGRYMVGAGLAASAAACCSLSGGIACAACAGGGWVANTAVGEFADGYCD